MLLLLPYERDGKGQGCMSLSCISHCTAAPCRGTTGRVEMLQAWYGRMGELQLWVPAVHTFPQVSAGILLDLASQGFLGVCDKLGAVLNKHHLISPALPPLLSCGHPHVWRRV